MVSFLFWGTVYISFKKYFSKHHKVILFLGILAVFTSSGLLCVFIEQLFFPSPKDFKPTYHMHQTWLNKCVMPGKQSDENFWCRDDCKAEKKSGIELLLIRHFSAALQHEMVSIFCHALEGCRLPMLCAGEPEPPAGYCCGYPGKPPAIHHLWCTMAPEMRQKSGGFVLLYS